MFQHQIGGGNCSLCKSPNTNKSNCPCNPDTTKPNFEKHYKWKEFCPQIKQDKVVSTNIVQVSDKNKKITKKSPKQLIQEPIVNKNIKKVPSWHKISSNQNLLYSPKDEITINDVKKMLGNQTKCLTGYEIKKILGQGSYGTVVDSCIDGDCNYAVKIMNSDENFQLEVDVATKMYNNGIGPKIYDIWECDDIAIIVYDKWDMDLDRYFQMFPTKRLSKHIIDKLEKDINKLHSIGPKDNYLVHFDLLPKNILVKLDKNNNIVDITMTDFGLIKNLKDFNRFKTWYKYFMEFTEGKAYFYDKCAKLPDNWEIITSSSGIPYFGNIITGQVQFEYPGDPDILEMCAMELIMENPAIFDDITLYYLRNYKSN